jgi:hypothetical protein
MANKTQLLKKMAKLESANDQILAELSYIDQLMRSVGFVDGLETVKTTARELLKQNDAEKKHKEASS